MRLQHTEREVAPALRSVGFQFFWESECLLSLVSELGIKGSSFEGRLWSLVWVEGFCGVQSKVK